MAAKVTFNTDRCKGCELCTTVCPKHIVVIDASVTNHKGYRHSEGHGAVHRLRQLREDLPGFHHHCGEILKGGVHYGKRTLERQ